MGDVFLRRKYGFAVDQHDVAADSQGGMREGEVDGLIGCSGPGHEGGAGEDACFVQFNDGPVDAGGQAEVVSINNEAAHCASVSTRRPELR